MGDFARVVGVDRQRRSIPSEMVAHILVVVWLIGPRQCRLDTYGEGVN